jgi:hypothetical protein
MTRMFDPRHPIYLSYRELGLGIQATRPRTAANRH